MITPSPTPTPKPRRNLSRNRPTIRRLVGDDLCNSLVLIRMPAGWREQLHEAASARHVTLNTLCLEAFRDVLDKAGQAEHATEGERGTT